MKEKTAKTFLTKRRNSISNIVLGFLVLSIGTLCLVPEQNTVYIDGKEAELYRSAPSNSSAVSLMFNVYWGTEEVYRILGVLKQHEAKATFFIGGCWADDNVDCLRAIYEAGHELGNHGYFHKDHDKLDYLQNKKEIESCNQFLAISVGVTPTLFAPPSGAYNSNTLSAVSELSMKTVLWSKDTIDWRDKNASIIYKRATNNIKKGDFILMHPMMATADALEDILIYYEKQNLPVITVSENLKEKG